MNICSLYLCGEKALSGMSPRRKRARKILNPPGIKALTPQTRGGGVLNEEPVVLLLEELESIKLCDYEAMSHHEASQLMGVSRPTFTRIYASARKKVATAFVEVRELIVEGGSVYYDSDWFQCQGCGCNFNHNDAMPPPSVCPLCGSHRIRNAVESENVEIDHHQKSVL